jgi:hypothetical protein
MYTPSISPQLVRVLYRMKRFYKKPITKLANELIIQSLSTVPKEEVCKKCISESNQKCEECMLAKI